MKSVRVASYNIHGCVGLDSRCEPGRIADIVAQLEAPIVGLQEARFHHSARELCQLEYLAKKTGMRAIAGATRTDGHSKFGNILLTRYPVISTQLLDLSFGRREPRCAIQAVLQVHDQLLKVIVTHLGLRSPERCTQMRKLVQLISGDAMPVVIMGDFNEWLPLTRSNRWIHQQFGKTRNPRTFPSYCPLFPLDRICSLNARLMESRAVDTRTTRIASDHLPILGRVAFV